jgi:ABC-type branched-subunit amino acid transport system ATPase component
MAAAKRFDRTSASWRLFSVDSRQNILSARAITAGYGGSAIVQELGLEVRAGSITGVIGPNGAGKSTLLKVLVGYLRPARGAIVFRGDDITRIAPELRVRRGIAYIAQARSYFASQTVAENLRLGAYLVRDAAVRAQREAAVFARFPVLADRRRQIAGMLSGGEARMLEFGRMLMMAPTFAILDEPSIGLSTRLVDEVYAHVRQLQSEGMTFLIVEQNVRKLFGVADYVYALESGRNRHAGTPDALSAEGVLASLYLGSGVGSVVRNGVGRGTPLAPPRAADGPPA